MSSIQNNKSSSDLRSKRIHVCFSDEEYGWLQLIAGREGVNVSAMLRMLVRKEHKVILLEKKLESEVRQFQSQKKSK